MKKTYKYVIELDKPVLPRNIAGELNGKVLEAKLISIMQYETACLLASLDEVEEE